MGVSSNQASTRSTSKNYIFFITALITGHAQSRVVRRKLVSYGLQGSSSAWEVFSSWKIMSKCILAQNNPSTVMQTDHLWCKLRCSNLCRWYPMQSNDSVTIPNKTSSAGLHITGTVYWTSCSSNFCLWIFVKLIFFSSILVSHGQAPDMVPYVFL